MTMQYIRTLDGTIYEWNEIMAAKPDCAVVTEEEAFPERVEAVMLARKLPAHISLETELAVEEPEEERRAREAISADASRGLEALAPPRGRAPKG